MVCHVYIALDERDVSIARSKTQKGDIIVTDIHCEPHLGVTYNAAFCDKDDPSLVPNFTKWIDAFAVKTPLFNGFANVLYQCSVRPLAGYIMALKRLLAEKAIEDIAVFIVRDLFWHGKTSTFYMAEYESIGTYFYDRHAVFLPYLKDYLSAAGVNVAAINKSLPKQRFFYNPLRKWAVFLGRFVSDFKKHVLGGYDDMTIDKRDVDYIFVIRATGQLMTILPLLEMTDKKVGVVLAASRTLSNVDQVMASIVENRQNIHCIRHSKVSLGTFLRGYLSVLKEFIWPQKQIFHHNGINVNLTQAMSEVWTMLPNIMVYQNIIEKMATKFSSPFLFSLEQKSPQAYVDAMVATQGDSLCAHIQHCQQSFFDIPHPVWGDYFLCESPKIQQAFAACWTQDKDKAVYVGTFQGIKKDQIVQGTQVPTRIKKVCMFLGVEKEINLEVLKDICGYARDLNIELSIKLHPRDFVRYEDDFPDIVVHRYYEGQFEDFCQNFDAIITYPSGVISDLIFTDIPFVVYLPEYKEYLTTERDFIPEGVLISSSFNEIFNVFQQSESFYKSYQESRQSYIRGRGIIRSLDVIEANFNRLNESKKN